MSTKSRQDLRSCSLRQDVICWGLCQGARKHSVQSLWHLHLDWRSEFYKPVIEFLFLKVMDIDSWRQALSPEAFFVLFFVRWSWCSAWSGAVLMEWQHSSSSDVHRGRCWGKVQCSAKDLWGWFNIYLPCVHLTHSVGWEWAFIVVNVYNFFHVLVVWRITMKCACAWSLAHYYHPCGLGVWILMKWYQWPHA